MQPEGEEKLCFDEPEVCERCCRGAALVHVGKSEEGGLMGPLSERAVCVGDVNAMSMAFALPAHAVYNTKYITYLDKRQEILYVSYLYR